MIHRLKPNESVSINGSTVNVAIDEGYVVLDVQTHDRDFTLLQEFVEFHLAYPAVYQQFLDECRRRVANDQPARARSVLTHVRSERRKKYGRGVLPLKDVYSSFYGSLAFAEGLPVKSDTDPDDVLAAIKSHEKSTAANTKRRGV